MGFDQNAPATLGGANLKPGAIIGEGVGATVFVLERNMNQKFSFDPLLVINVLNLF